MSSVTVVVGGWGRDDDGLTLDPGQREKVFAIDANLELLSPQKTWTNLSSVEVVSPSGGCNNKLRPLPQPARHPLAELVDGVLVVCGDLRQCWTYSQGKDSWSPTMSLAQERRRASSVSVGGRLFVTGGYLPGQPTFNSTEVWTREVYPAFSLAVYNRTFPCMEAI